MQSPQKGDFFWKKLSMNAVLERTTVKTGQAGEYKVKQSQNEADTIQPITVVSNFGYIVQYHPDSGIADVTYRDKGSWQQPRVYQIDPGIFDADLSSRFMYAEHINQLGNHIGRDTNHGKAVKQFANYVLDGTRTVTARPFGLPHSEAQSTPIRRVGALGSERVFTSTQRPAMRRQIR